MMAPLTNFVFKDYALCYFPFFMFKSSTIYMVSLLFKETFYYRKFQTYTKVENNKPSYTYRPTSTIINL